MLGNGYHDIPRGKVASVVTHLEMTSPAPLRPAPEVAGAIIRRVSEPDVDWYRDIFQRVGAQEWMWFSRLELGDAALAAILKNPLVQCYALQIQGHDKGLLELDFRHNRECELAFFGTTRDMFGTGAGRMLMNQAISAAWVESISRFYVHTCTLDHPAALAFYQRSGFIPVRQQIEIADDPRLNGVMQRGAGPNVPIIE